MDDKIKNLRNNPDAAKNFFMECLAFTIGPVELKDLMDNEKVNLLDVRRDADYEVSHIPGATSIPKDELPDKLDRLEKGKTTVVYCYNSQCHLGAEACLILADYKYPCVHLEGGFKVWKEDFRFATT